MSDLNPRTAPGKESRGRSQTVVQANKSPAGPPGSTSAKGDSQRSLCRLGWDPPQELCLLSHRWAVASGNTWSWVSGAAVEGHGQFHYQQLEVCQVCRLPHQQWHRGKKFWLVGSRIKLSYRTAGFFMEAGRDFSESSDLPFGSSAALSKKSNLLKPVSSPVVWSE